MAATRLERYDWRPLSVGGHWRQGMDVKGAKERGTWLPGMVTRGIRAAGNQRRPGGVVAGAAGRARPERPRGGGADARAPVGTVRPKMGFRASPCVTSMRIPARPRLKIGS